MVCSTETCVVILKIQHVRVALVVLSRKLKQSFKGLPSVLTSTFCELHLTSGGASHAWVVSFDALLVNYSGHHYIETSRQFTSVDWLRGMLQSS
eukprot:jgi/Botrbrau1/12808/Bobra.117_1s0024.1